MAAEEEEGVIALEEARGDEDPEPLSGTNDDASAFGVAEPAPMIAVAISLGTPSIVLSALGRV